MKLSIYVSIEEANGYPTIFDVWADYNFPYIRMKLLHRSETRPETSSSLILSQQIKKEVITIKIWF